VAGRLFPVVCPLLLSDQVLTYRRTDHGSVGVSSTSAKSYNAIDPNLIMVGSTPYLNFGSFWDDIFQVKMSTSLKTTAGSASYNIEYDSAGTHPCEGSYMFYYDGYYYLLWSHGICCNYETYVHPFRDPSTKLIGSN
jgi:arabinan endo-1,5-alpha-L-arabinosidase